LYITWADRQVFGSPFKVTVLPSSVTESSGGGGTGVIGSGMLLSRGGPGSVDMVDSSSSRVMQTTQTMTQRSATAAAGRLSCYIFLWSAFVNLCVCLCLGGLAVSVAA